MTTTSTMALNAEVWDAIVRGVAAIWLYAAVGLVLMLVGFYALDWTTPGPLRCMVKEGKPNATIVASAGMVSMAAIVVLAIYASSGALAQGLTVSAVFGLVGIAVQVLMMRVMTLVLGVDMARLFEADGFCHQTLIVAAAQLALGSVVAVAIF